MKNLTISIFGSKVFLEILKEINLFPDTKIIFFDDYKHSTLNEVLCEQIIVFFLDKNNINDYFQLKNRNLPILIVIDSSKPFKEINNFTNQITAPFKILNFKKKIIAVLASDKFKKSSIIQLGRYIINKNERKIIKDKLKLKLTEKEINFLILFTSHDKPLSKEFILKNLWNYSPETNTHTIETHIHRLRKKIFQKFEDNNFIKNNDAGYYI